MPLPLLLPIGVAILGGLAYQRVAARDKAKATSSISGENDGFTPERRVIYTTLLRKCKDPQKLTAAAATFRANGLEPQAVMLEKRAQLRSLPLEARKARALVFRKAMASTNVDGIMKVAQAYEDQGSTGCAARLRAYAEGLRVAA